MVAESVARCRPVLKNPAQSAGSETRPASARMSRLTPQSTFSINPIGVSAFKHIVKTRYMIRPSTIPLA